MKKTGGVSGLDISLWHPPKIIFFPTFAIVFSLFFHVFFHCFFHWSSLVGPFSPNCRYDWKWPGETIPGRPLRKGPLRARRNFVKTNVFDKASNTRVTYTKRPARVGNAFSDRKLSQCRMRLRARIPRRNGFFRVRRGDCCWKRGFRNHVVFGRRYWGKSKFAGIKKFTKLA